MAESDSSRGADAEASRRRADTFAPSQVTNPGIHDELVQFWLTLWRGRWLLFLTVVVCTAVGVGYALLATQWYVSEALLIPATPKSTQNLPGQLANLGGLAGLAGINLLGSNNTSEPIAVLRSRDLIREFIQKNDLLPVLYSDKWDATAARWKDARLSKQPDLRDGVKLFQKTILTVQDDKKTGLVSLAVEWKDPTLAADWANQLIERVNERMRARATEEAEANITYLQSQLGSTSQATLQQTVSRLLENELQKAMLARGNKEFAFRIVDRPEVPKHRTHPNRPLTAALGFLAGGILGVLVVFVRGAFRGAASTGRGLK
jgi:uncharacterized protein involved in exopolysaccharide biosynthesis